VLVDPVSEVALVHLGRRDVQDVARGANAVAKPFHRAEEERFLPAVVDLRDHNRSSHAPAEVVLFVSAPLCLEESAGVEYIVTEKLIGGSVQAAGPGLGCKGHDAAGSAAELGLVALGIDRKITDPRERRRVRAGPLYT